MAKFGGLAFTEQEFYSMPHSRRKKYLETIEEFKLIPYK